MSHIDDLPDLLSSLKLSHTITITLSGSSNYADWLEGYATWAREKGVWRTVQAGTPPANEPEEGKEKRLLLEDKARARLDSTVDRSIRLQFLNTLLSTEAKSNYQAKTFLDWLQTRFAGATPANLSQSVRRIMTTPLSSSELLKWVNARNEDITIIRSAGANDKEVLVGDGFLSIMLKANFPSANEDVELGLVLSRLEALATPITPETIFDELRKHHDQVQARQVLSPSSNALLASPSPARAQPSSKPAESAVWCTLHDSSTHNTEDCKTLKDIKRKRGQGWGNGNRGEKGGGETKDIKEEGNVAAANYFPSDFSNGFSDFKPAYITGDALLVGTDIPLSPTSIILDSGASVTMVSRAQHLRRLTPFDGSVNVGNGATIRATHRGEAVIHTSHGSILLPEVWLVPEVSRNLLSQSSLQRLGYHITSSPNLHSVVSKNGKAYLHANASSGLPVVDGQFQSFGQPPSSSSLLAASNPPKSHLHDCHSRLAHVSLDRVVQLIRAGRLGGRTIVTQTEIDAFECDACICGKSKRQPSRRNPTSAAAIGDIVYLDIFGPTKTQSLGGARYMLVLLDDHSRKLFVRFLLAKSQASTHVKELCQLFFNHSQHYPRRVHSDQGGEFLSHHLRDFFTSKGIEHTTTAADAHNQNARVERAMSTILDGVRTLLLSSGLPPRLWAEAANFLVYNHNRAPA